jgi:hypothetical protein
MLIIFLFCDIILHEAGGSEENEYRDFIKFDYNKGILGIDFVHS